MCRNHILGAGGPPLHYLKQGPLGSALVVMVLRLPAAMQAQQVQALLLQVTHVLVRAQAQLVPAHTVGDYRCTGAARAGTADAGRSSGTRGSTAGAVEAVAGHSDAADLGFVGAGCSAGLAGAGTASVGAVVGAEAGAKGLVVGANVASLDVVSDVVNRAPAARVRHGRSERLQAVSRNGKAAAAQDPAGNDVAWATSG